MRFRRQLTSLLWRAPVEDEVEAELAFHLEMTTRALVESGLPLAAARAEAARRLGDRDRLRDECRRYGHERDRLGARAEYLSELRQDAVVAWRQLRRSPTFAAVAAITLALGIGATAAVFSALDAVVLRPLPFPHPDRVVRILAVRPQDAGAFASNAELDAWRSLHEHFDDVGAAVTGRGFTLTDGDVPQVVGGAAATAGYLRAFGVSPALGRVFDANEDRPGAPQVVVLSHRLWTTQFGADRSVLGRDIHLSGRTYSVIGVMPASFDITADGDALWVPLALSSDALNDADGQYLHVVARLRPGVTRAEAEQAVRAAERGMATRLGVRDTTTRPVVRSYAEQLAGDYRSRLLVLLGAVGFVLLIACVNVANLLLARGTARARELAIRAALGAGRTRLLRQLLTESLVLSLTGAVLGVALAYALVRALIAVSPPGVPRLDQARVDGRVLALALLLAVACSVISGLLPALRAARRSVSATLRAGGRGTIGASGRDRMQAVFVAAEVALAMTLLTGAGLLLRSGWSVQHVDPGFDPRDVLTSRIILPSTRYTSTADVVRLYDRIHDEASRLPGVRSAALVSVVPLSGSSMAASVSSEAVPRDAANPLIANLRFASAGYFRTMRIRMLDGRDFSRFDDASAPAVVIVSRSLAQRLWPGQRALGQRLNTLGKGPDEPRWWEVIGVVDDLRESTLAGPAEPACYVPYAQLPGELWAITQRTLDVVARTTGNSGAVARSLRRALLSIDPSVPLANPTTMAEYVDGSIATARFNTLLLTALGAIALGLASVGIYGVVGYFVSQRTAEIGVRVALGATPRRIWSFVVQRGLRPILIGGAAGVALSAITSGVLRGQLYGVTASDPWTRIAVALLLLAVSLLAMYIPARRAMRVAPAVALNSGA